MKQLLFILLVASATSCGLDLNQELPANASDLVVNDFLTLTPEGSKIIAAKMCTEDSEFEYIYQLEIGIWVASNKAYRIGDYLGVCEVSAPKRIESKTADEITITTVTKDSVISE